MNNQTITISLDHATTIVNMLAYENYAKLKRRLMAIGVEDNPSFDAFYTDCSKCFDMEILPMTAWLAGYEFISDLFYDNERFGTPCDESARFARNVMQLLDMFNK
jgi:hypothetical protein